MVAALTLSFAGCKKESTSTSTTNTESMQQLSKDETNVENATDKALNDAEYYMIPAALKSVEIGGGPCNTTKVTTGPTNDTITTTITYNGPDCNNIRTRSGQVIVKRKFQEYWGTPGATVLVYLNNFTTTRISNGKSLTLNGEKHFENVSGHYLFELGLDSNVTSVVHREWGSVTATFDDNTHKVWNLDRQRTFTGSLIALVMTVDGLGSADGYSNLASWGTDRNNELFYSSINQSIVYKQLCDWDPCSGIIIHQIPSIPKSATITYGYDSNNNLITNGDCPTRYRVDWIVGTKSGTFFLPL